MLGNIIDHRTDRSTLECDAAFEPSAHDNARRPDGRPWFMLEVAESDAAYFLQLATVDTTVRLAILEAEETFAFAVTVSLFDKGSLPRPLEDLEIRKALSAGKRAPLLPK